MMQFYPFNKQIYKMNQFKYSFQQKNQDFPESPKRKAIGKIMSKYVRLQQQQTPSHQSYSRVRNGINLNYSQIYQDIRLSHNNQQHYKRPQRYTSVIQLKKQKQLLSKTGIIHNFPTITLKNQAYQNQQIDEEVQTSLIANIEDKQQQQQIINGHIHKQIQNKSYLNQSRKQSKSLAQFNPKNNPESNFAIKYQQNNSKILFQGTQLQKDQNIVMPEFNEEQILQNLSKPISHISNRNRNSKETLTKLAQQLNNSKLHNNTSLYDHQIFQQNNHLKDKITLEQQGQKLTSNKRKAINQTRQLSHVILNQTVQHTDDKNEDSKSINNHQKVNKIEKKNNSQLNNNVTNKSTIKQSEFGLTAFTIEDYSQVYPILKSMQTALRNQVIDYQNLIKCIKKYLELIACGTLDNIDEFNLELHKKKIIKTALLYQRVAVIVIAFSYANNSLQQSHKYLINSLSYSLSTTLLLVKVLQGSQILPIRNQILKKSDRLIMKKSIDTIRNNNDVLIDSIYKLSKYDNLFYENLKQIVKMLPKSTLQQSFYNVLQYFAFFLCVSDMYQMLPFLAVAPDPYLPPCLSHRYTLVVDTVDIFYQGIKKAKHYTHHYRPYTQHFLAQMSNYFQIVSFTNSLPNQIDKLINSLDPKKYIKHRLYKHHGIHKMSAWVKQLSRLGRDLSNVILLDIEHSPSAKQNQCNCIMLPQWKGTKNDSVLAQLCPVLAMIAIKQIDARVAVNKIRQQSHKNQSQGLKYVNFGINFQ